MTLSLHILGSPSSPDLSEELARLAKNDQRISLRLERFSDSTLVREVSEADLVVLPYSQMHNSGAVLTALSLNRPVLVPDNTVNRGIQLEVGERWVMCYSPPLTPSILTEALSNARSIDPSEGPVFHERDWNTLATLHRAAYLAARDGSAGA